MGPRSNPPQPFRPGEVISARRLTETAEDAWRGAQLFAAGNLAASRVAGGPPVLNVDLPQEVYARISGRGSACASSGTSGHEIASGTAGPNCYCGIEWASDKYGGLDDVQSGLIFDAFGFPLVEMTGRDDVPVDAIVRAYRARSGDHYEFVWGGSVQMGSATDACVKCCCCCIPCKGPIWLTIPTFGIDHGCNLGGSVTFPTFMLQGAYPTWTCAGSSPWIVAVAKVGDVSMGSIDLTITLECRSKTSCPILTIRGTYTVNSDGAAHFGVNAGTYQMCIGPISFDETTGCNVRDDDDPSGGPVNWAASLHQATVNDCDRNNWDCPCHTQLGGDITAICGVSICEASGLLTSFSVTIIDTGILFGGDIEFGAGGKSGTMTAIVGPLGNYACYQEWTGKVTSASGCIVDVLLPLNESGTFDISAILSSDPSNSGPCTTLLNNIIAGDFMTMTQTRLICNPFCLEFKSNGGAGPGIVRFGLCP